jgi:UMF1 family MFS transporter
MYTSWLDRLGLHRPELRAWALYDVANSAWMTTIKTTVFPPFFVGRTAAR